MRCLKANTNVNKNVDTNDHVCKQLWKILWIFPHFSQERRWEFVLSVISFLALLTVTGFVQSQWQLQDLGPCSLWLRSSILELTEHTAVVTWIEIQRWRRKWVMLLESQAVLLMFQLLWTQKPFFFLLPLTPCMNFWCGIESGSFINLGNIAICW